MNKKILVITDMDSSGSGYKTICVPLFKLLGEMGYEIKISGLMYRGEEHNYPFSIIPARDVQESVGIANNLMYLWNPDLVIVAMDIPLQISIFNQLAPFKKKYIAITPLENPPLTMSWAMPLFQMDKVFFISELGKQEAIKVGMTNVDHLQIGVDTVSWHPATPDEKKQLRDGLGIPQDVFVVLTVADNQERKNLWAGLKSISLLKKEVERPIRYILVTREQNPYGWKLRDLIKDLDIRDEVIIFERGLPQKDLWGLYAVSDVYLQPSKAEGLGLPVMDAMASGIPVVATDTGAMHELLDNERGLLVKPEYTVGADVWGNELRDFINIEKTKNYLKDVIIWSSEESPFSTEPALDYIQKRDWKIPANQLDEEIRKLLDEPQAQQ